jgi:hypothetical protein
MLAPGLASLANAQQVGQPTTDSVVQMRRHAAAIQRVQAQQQH